MRYEVNRFLEWEGASPLKSSSEGRTTRVQNLNLREIARRARVSTATVSRAINRIPTVNPYLAKRVWKVVEDLGYYPNTQARSLVSGHSRILGVIVPELTNPFFAEIVQAFENVVVQQGYEILLSSTGNDLCRVELAARQMIERRVDGVAALTFAIEDSILADLLFHGIPLAAIHGASQIPGVSNIRINYHSGIRQAVQHLAALRHIRIAFVAGPEHLPCTRLHREAFEGAMREIGADAPGEFMVSGEQSVESGMRALQELWTLPVTPTAILCSNDMTAIGVLVQAHERGIAVPQQLSVVGFEDVRPAQFTVPPLTTVRISSTELAMLAFQALADGGRVRSSPETDEYVVETSLVLRRSTALRLVPDPWRGSPGSS